MASPDSDLTRLEKYYQVEYPDNPLPATRRRQIGQGNLTIKGWDQYKQAQGPQYPWIDFYNPPKEATVNAGGTQVTVSEGHPFHSSKRKGMSDIGGNFYTQKRYIKPLKTQHIVSEFLDASAGNQPCRGIHSGPLLPFAPDSVSGYGDFASSNSTLDALGTTAISRCKPTNPVASLTTALLELRKDGLPHLLGSSLWEGKTSIIRSAGDEYLNQEFGWEPLINDITSFGSGVAHADTVIKQYKRGIGRPTRRRYDFEPTETVTRTVLGTAYPFYPFGLSFLCHANAGQSQPGTLVLERKVVQERWFSGAFTYYFTSQVEEKLGDLAILAKQLGLELTPEVLWNVAPWSWAVDWFTNIGDVISNYTAFHQDGLVMSYGYVMEHTIATYTYKLEGAILSNGKPAPVQDLVYVIETKQRRGATPYGFGLSFGALSGFQQSILGALGLTKIFR